MIRVILDPRSLSRSSQRTLLDIATLKMSQESKTLNPQTLRQVLSSCTGSQKPIQKTKQYTTANQWLWNKERTMVIPLWTGKPGQNPPARPLTHYGPDEEWTGTPGQNPLARPLTHYGPDEDVSCYWSSCLQSYREFRTNHENESRERITRTK